MLARALLAAVFLCVGAPAAAAECADLWDWLNRGCRRLVDTYEKGDNVLLVSGYAWHTPWTWTPEKRAEENEYAWGGGLGRMVEHANGDTETVSFLVFSDSHYRPQYNLGYAWSTYWGERRNLQPGLGFMALIVARNDIFNGWPFPAVLPLFSLRYQKATLLGTYIPTLGGVNNGSILYLFGQIALD
jgi:lipid IVA palmitoyltransferase